MRNFIDKQSLVRPFLAALIVAGLQTGVIGYIVQSRAAILRDGSDILLKTAPVDPRDFLRGDYVVLNYDISAVPVSTLVGTRPAEGREERLWVRLKPREDRFWAVAESSLSPLPAADGTVVLRTQPFKAYIPQSGGVFNVSYGIERYYVPQGTGLRLEQENRQGDVSIAARVSTGGQAQIRQILVDNKPVYEEPLY